MERRKVAIADTNEERRKYKRVMRDFPVAYKIRGTAVLGKAVNACNEGMLVESYLPLKTAVWILGILEKRREYRVELEFAYDEAYRGEAETRHFHLDFSGKEPCRFIVGFFVQKIEHKI